MIIIEEGSISVLRVPKKTKSQTKSKITFNEAFVC